MSGYCWELVSQSISRFLFSIFGIWHALPADTTLGKRALTWGLSKANSQSEANNEFGLMRKAREQTMNELKPEDVMKALDILDKMEFFQGQRAGRELWLEKPFEVQEQDIADFSQGIEFVKNLVTNALALLVEKDAEIERLTAQIEHCDACDRIGLTYSEHIVCIKQAKAEAITEFAERVKRRLPIVSPSVFDKIAKEMKGETDDSVSESKD